MNRDAEESAEASLRVRRAALVRTQIDAENQQDITAVIATFHRLYYEFVPLDWVADSAATLHELLHRLTAGFPNLYAEIFILHQADAAIIIEGRLVGTQLGSWAGLPASGRVINLPFVAIFDFDEDRLMGKRIYFDSGLMLQQLSGHDQAAGAS